MSKCLVIIFTMPVPKLGPYTAFVLCLITSIFSILLTENCPKPLLPVYGKPIMEHIIIRGISEGFSKLSIWAFNTKTAYSPLLPFKW